MNKYNKNIGREVKDAAVAYVKAGHTQREAADKFNVTNGAVCRWINGKDKKILEKGAPTEFYGHVYWFVDPYKVLNYVKKHPDATVAEVIRSGAAGKYYSYSVVRRLLKTIKAEGLADKETEQYESEEAPESEYIAEYIVVPADTLDKIRSEVSSFRIVLDKLKRQTETLKRENSSLKSELNACKSDNGFLRRRIAECQYSC